MKTLILVGMLAFPFVQERTDPKTASAVTKTETPVLTTEQKQAVEILALRIELAQQKAQAAQAAFEKARTEIAALVQSLQKEGFELDLQTLTYKKVEKK